MATSAKPALVSRAYLLPFVLITSLFFLWGFARSILDVLNKHFQDALDLSKTESAMIQVMVYSAYFLVAIPAGLFISKYGYRKGVVCGLLLFAAGAALFIPSESVMSFACFLGSLFVLGCGLVFLETAANPYAAGLGDPRTGASRLNLSQAFNGLGCIFGPLVGAEVLFKEGSTSGVALPYAVMGAIVLVIALVFTRVNLPEINRTADSEASKVKATDLWKHRAFTFGLFAIFCYEIAEISINSFFINYITDDGTVTPHEAAMLLSICGLGLFFAGRVVGSLIMSRVRAQLVLLVCAAATVVCTILVTLNLGAASRLALYACYLFESIMFPTIFALSVGGLNSYLTKRAASFLMMSPIGGAVGTLLMGYAADTLSMSTAFIVPMAGYAVVLGYALSRK